MLHPSRAPILLVLITLLFLFTGRVFNGSGKAIDKGPAVMAEDFLDIQGKAEMYQAVHPIYELKMRMNY